MKEKKDSLYLPNLCPKKELREFLGLSSNKALYRHIINEEVVSISGETLEEVKAQNSPLFSYRTTTAIYVVHKIKSLR